MKFKLSDFDSEVEMLEVINEQHEQIQALIQSSKEFEEDCQSTFDAMSRKQNDLYRKNFKLKEEIEQLRKENNELKLILQEYEFAKEDGYEIGEFKR